VLFVKFCPIVVLPTHARFTVVLKSMYSGAMVVYQPSDGLVNNDLEVIEIVNKYCHVNVARAGGQGLCLSVTTGAHVQTCFDPVITISHINDLIDQGSTNPTVCRREAFDCRIYNKGKISCLVSQHVVHMVTNVKWDLTPQFAHTSPNGTLP
jgi:hypothetical protein